MRWLAGTASERPTMSNPSTRCQGRALLKRATRINGGGRGFAMRRAFRIALDAYWRFNADDGWAVASNIALSALMALFPFLIVLTSLAATFGSSDLAEKVVQLMFATWPEEVARTISGEIHDALRPRRDLFTLGLIFAIYFASSGIESLRIGLNRAYGMAETRNWLMLRLESV